MLPSNKCRSASAVGRIDRDGKWIDESDLQFAMNNPTLRRLRSLQRQEKSAAKSFV